MSANVRVQALTFDGTKVVVVCTFFTVGHTTSSAIMAVVRQTFVWDKSCDKRTIYLAAVDSSPLAGLFQVDVVSISMLVLYTLQMK